VDTTAAGAAGAAGAVADTAAVKDTMGMKADSLNTAVDGAIHKDSI
jgi:hypothetical protein